MGWDAFNKAFCFTNGRGQIDRKATVIHEIEVWGDCEVVKAAMAGTTFYGIVHNIKRDKHYLTVILTNVHDDEFAYKEMTDTMGPYEKDCPKSILDLADELCPCTEEYDYGGYAKAWRKACRERLVIKNSPTAFKNVKPGESVMWHVPEDSFLMMDGQRIAGLNLRLTKVEGTRSWVHFGLWKTRIPTKYVNPVDCKLMEER